MEYPVEPKKRNYICIELPLASTSIRDILKAYKQIIASYPNASNDEIRVKVSKTDNYYDDDRYTLSFIHESPNDKYHDEMIVYDAKLKAYKEYEHELRMVRNSKYRAEHDRLTARREWKNLHRSNRIQRQQSPAVIKNEQK